MTDSGGAGKFRGGSGTAWEVEPLDKEMLCIGFGEGRRIPAMGAAGAYSHDIDSKVGRVELKRARQGSRPCGPTSWRPSSPAIPSPTRTPEAVAMAIPMSGPLRSVVWDVKNGLVSIKGAKEDYGVVITDPETLDVDLAATQALRSAA